MSNRLIALMGEQFNPLEVDQQIARTNYLDSQNRMAGLKMDEYQRGLARQNKLMELTSQTGGDVNKLAPALYQGGFIEEAAKLEKHRADIGKTQADADSSQFKLATDRHDYFKKTLGALAQDPALNKDLAVRVGQDLVQKGIIPAEMYQQSIQDLPDDPVQLRERLMHGVRTQMTPEQMFTIFAAKPERIDNGQQISFRDMNPNSPTFGKNVGGAAVQKQQSPDSVASNALGWANNRLSRERLAFEQSQPKGQYDAERGVIVDTRTGVARPVVGADGQAIAPGGKAPTEFQGKSAAFGARAEEADKIISDLTGKYRPAAINAKATVSSWPVVGGILGDATNALSLTDNDQKAEQAQRDFINAVLRQESGAVIADAEFDNARRQYFPQPGDSKAVIEQKERNRKLAVQGLRQNAGKAGFSAPSQRQGQDDVLKAADAILGL